MPAGSSAVAGPIRIVSDRMRLADPPSSYRAIETLIATYAELVDATDFAGVGVLLPDATFMGVAGSVTGREAIEKLLRDSVIIYDDGTPRTKHVTTNLAIEVDEAAGAAVSRSYFTALQALPDMALQPIVSGRYHDRFARLDGRWPFVERRVRTDLFGDLSRHLRRSAVQPGVALKETDQFPRLPRRCSPRERLPHPLSITAAVGPSETKNLLRAESEHLAGDRFRVSVASKCAIGSATKGAAAAAVMSRPRDRRCCVPGEHTVCRDACCSIKPPQQIVCFGPLASVTTPSVTL